MKAQTIPNELFEQIAPELLTGESLLWAGTPRSRRRFQPNQLHILVYIGSGLVAVGLTFAMFILFRSAAVASLSGLIVLTLVFLLVLALALNKQTFPALRQMLSGTSITYAITDRRIIIMSGATVQSYGANDIDFIERHMHKDGTGDLLFKRELKRRQFYKQVYSEQQAVVDVGLYGVENPREIETLLLEVFRPSGAVYKHDERDEWVYEDEFDTPQDQQASQ